MATRELEAEHVRWLWQGRLAFGKLTSMVGQEDRRKSFLCATIAATTNTGGEWPGGGRSEPGHVVYLQAEDGFHDTTLPRLQAAGAKVTNEPVRSAGMEPQRAPRRLFRPDQFRPSRIRVRLFLHQPTYFTIVPPRPQAQSLIAALNELEQDYLTIPNLRLFIIDPFNAFSEGQTTHHMAGALRRLQHIAEKYDVALLLVHHLHNQPPRTLAQ